MLRRALFLTSIAIILLFVFAKIDESAVSQHVDAATLYSASKDAIVVIFNEKNDAPDTKKKDGERKSSRSALNSRPSIINHLPYTFYKEDGVNRIVAVSTGTGFFVHEDRVIVTSFHVVQNSKNINVQLSDGSIFSAQIIGFDARPEYDIALLKITTGRKVPILKLTQSDVFIGMPLLLIGHPYLLTYTSSSAEISNLDAGLNFVQIYSSIHPGNSGSPLLNASGEVIGVIYAKIMNSETQGLATPALKVREVINRILRPKADGQSPQIP